MKTYLTYTGNAYTGSQWQEIQVDEAELEHVDTNLYLYNGLRVYQCDPVADKYFWLRYTGQINWLAESTAFNDK